LKFQSKIADFHQMVNVLPKYIPFKQNGSFWRAESPFSHKQATSCANCCIVLPLLLNSYFSVHANSTSHRWSRLPKFSTESGQIGPFKRPEKTANFPRRKCPSTNLHNIST
jgi:hypothetical protein